MLVILTTSVGRQYFINILVLVLSFDININFINAFFIRSPENGFHSAGCTRWSKSGLLLIYFKLPISVMLYLKVGKIDQGLCKAN